MNFQYGCSTQNHPLPQSTRHQLTKTETQNNITNNNNNLLTLPDLIISLYLSVFQSYHNPVTKTITTLINNKKAKATIFQLLQKQKLKKTTHRLTCIVSISFSLSASAAGGVPKTFEEGHPFSPKYLNKPKSAIKPTETQIPTNHYTFPKPYLLAIEFIGIEEERFIF